MVSFNSRNTDDEDEVGSALLRVLTILLLDFCLINDNVVDGFFMAETTIVVDDKMLSNKSIVDIDNNNCIRGYRFVDCRHM